MGLNLIFYIQKLIFFHDKIRLNILSVLLTEKTQPFNSWPYGDLFYTVKFIDNSLTCKLLGTQLNFKKKRGGGGNSHLKG